MIPAAFDYEAPTTLAEALRLLENNGNRDVKILGGGQSLLPVLRLRLAEPELLIDLGRIGELRGIADDGDAIVIGAMTTHDDLTRDHLVRRHAMLLAQTAATVADPQVRHRGTFGGSLAHADPAGDLLAPALALDAEFVIAGRDGQRRSVAAAEFFTDMFTTALGPTEVLASVRVPKHTGWGSHYEKFHHTAQSWSIVGVAAVVRRQGDSIAEAKVALTNMGLTPIRARAVEQALIGQPATEQSIRAAATLAAEGTAPMSDANADDDYRRHLATVLTRRAVLAAVS